MSAASPAEIFRLQKDTTSERRATFGLAERCAALLALRETIKRRQADIVAAMAADFAKPEPEVILTEIVPVLAEIAHALRHLRAWMRPQRVAPTLATFGTAARIHPEPRGVCLVIAPWNYPFNLALAPVVSALAAGNSAIVKPSELTPATSALLAAMVAETFPPHLLAVVEGGAETAQALLALPFDHIFFTGSPQVGKIVMAAAAKTLASVTLELGGKSPTIVGPEADLEQAARWIAWGKFANAGQTCIAPDHVFVHSAVADGFRQALRREIGRAYGGDAAAQQASRDYARIISDRHAARLGKLVEDAVTKGARIICGGESQGRFMAPTLIEAVTPEMEIDGEEIFGPVLPLIGFDDVDRVIERINGRPKPLALYVFDRRKRFAQHIVDRTSSGGVGVNLTMLHYSHPNLPFGGVNNSGLGAAHGIFGFRTFSHMKPVLENRFSLLPQIFPPYTERVRWLLGAARRYFG